MESLILSLTSPNRIQVQFFHQELCSVVRWSACPFLIWGQVNFTANTTSFSSHCLEKPFVLNRLEASWSTPTYLKHILHIFNMPQFYLLTRLKFLRRNVSGLFFSRSISITERTIKVISKVGCQEYCFIMTRKSASKNRGCTYPRKLSNNQYWCLQYVLGGIWYVCYKPEAMRSAGRKCEEKMRINPRYIQMYSHTHKHKIVYI